jgi:hypothetical protein
MTGRKRNAVSTPGDTLVLLALDALLRYQARGLLLPADIVFFEALDRLAGDDSAE